MAAGPCLTTGASNSALAAGVTRIAGADRVETALAVFEGNRDVFTSDTVVLTGASPFADALTATPLAAAL